VSPALGYPGQARQAPGASWAPPGRAPGQASWMTILDRLAREDLEDWGRLKLNFVTIGPASGRSLLSTGARDLGTPARLDSGPLSIRKKIPHGQTVLLAFFDF